MREQGGMNPVRSRRRADERRLDPGKPSGEAGSSCVRPNRVVLAVVATAKPCEDALGPNRVASIVNSRGDGGKQELVSGESAPYAVKPSRREGLVSAALCLPCALRVHSFSAGVLWVPAGARPSLRPFQMRA